MTHGYTVTRIGEPVVFLIPEKKLALPATDGSGTVGEALDAFLDRHFGAFTMPAVPHVGHYRDATQRIVVDICQRYEVSFDGEERLYLLFNELARICTEIDEECLYVLVGGRSHILRPAASASAEPDASSGDMPDNPQESEP